LRQPREERGLLEREARGVHAEVGARRGFDPVGLAPEVDVVQVRREDAVLAPATVELYREAALRELAAERLLRAAVEVAHELLLDRRGTLRELAGGDVGLERPHDPDVVDAVVLVEAAVLGVDDRATQDRADALERDGEPGAACAEQPEP